MANRIAALMGKDFRSLLNERMTAGMFLLLLVLSAFMAPSLSFTGLGLAFYAVSIFILFTFSLEEKFRTARFFASLPVRRRDVVAARYGSVIAMTLVFIALALIMDVILIAAGNPNARPIPLGYCAMALALVSFFTSFSLPFYFKFGMAEKARIVTILIIVIPVTLGGAAMGVGNAGVSAPFVKTVQEFTANPYPRDIPASLILIGAAILLWVVSFPVSVRLYAGRDL